MSPFRSRFPFASLALLLALAPAVAAGTERIHPVLLEQLAAVEDGELVEAYLVMQDQLTLIESRPACTT